MQNWNAEAETKTEPKALISFLIWFEVCILAAPSKRIMPRRLSETIRAARGGQGFI